MKKILISLLLCASMCENLISMTQAKTISPAVKTEVVQSQTWQPTPKHLLIAAGAACAGYALYKIIDSMIDAYKFRKNERDRKLIEDAEQELLRMSVRGTGEIVHAILENNKNININIRDPQTGDTALIRAAREANRWVVKELLDHGADCLLQNFNGRRAIDYVAAPRTAELLKQAATHMLWKAIKDGNVLVLHAAIASQAELEAKNEAGKTAVMQAHLCNDEEIVRILIEYGATLHSSHNKTASIEDAGSSSDDDVDVPLSDVNS